ncbi:MAG: tRNA adenosine(34) deaminase TadA [bacterium]|nr:tRNA adenosine(34) deaminase TadA [bacterium]
MKLDHQYFMRLALREAHQALKEGEVPVGAVVVHDQHVIGRAHNQVERLRDATAHAEMIALTQAASALGDWRLLSCTLYVTLEPCAMCAGALVQCRVGTLVFGARDWQQGGTLSNFGIVNYPKNLHKVAVIEGILEDECKQLLQSFFTRLRANRR